MSIQSGISNSKAVAAGVLYGVVGGEAFIVQPGFVQGMSSVLGFSDAQVGQIAAAEMFGFAFATIALIFLTARVNWQHAIRVALGLMIAGNLLSFLTMGSSDMFAVTRFIAGLGGGATVSLGFATLGLTDRPDRNFGLMVMSAMVFGAIVLYAMPYLYDLASMDGLLILFAAGPLVGLLLAGGLPQRAEEAAQVEADAVDMPWSLRGMALVTMLFYFLAQGAVWAYLALIGIGGGMEDQALAQALALSQVTGLAGAMVAVFFGAKFGRLGPLAIAVLCGLGPLAYMLTEFTVSGFYLAVLVYNFGFNMAHPFLLAIMASFDTKGRTVVYAVAMQTVGMAVGPLVAAQLVGGESFDLVIQFGMVCFSVALILIARPCLVQAALANLRQNAQSTAANPN